jgi:hypothetical protein
MGANPHANGGILLRDLLGLALGCWSAWKWMKSA